MKELENHLANKDFLFDSTSSLETAIIVDFMSTIRKVQFTKLKTFGESFECVWLMVRNICNTDEIHFVYDSYIQCSLKECERECRTTEGTVEVINLAPETSIPVEMQRFLGSSKTKSNLQILSREHFTDKSKENSDVTVVLSGYVTDGNGIESCIKIRNGVASAKQDLDSFLEEADCRIILHVADASDNGCKRILIALNGSNVVIYALSYFGSFYVEELWVRFGSRINTKNILIHLIFNQLGENISYMVLKSYIPTGCDMMSKVGTKAAALMLRLKGFCRILENTM